MKFDQSKNDLTNRSTDNKSQHYSFESQNSDGSGYCKISET